MIYDVSDGYFKSFLEAEGVAAHKFFSALGIHLQEEEGSVCLGGPPCMCPPCVPCSLSLSLCVFVCVCVCVRVCVVPVHVACLSVSLVMGVVFGVVCVRLYVVLYVLSFVSKGLYVVMFVCTYSWCMHVCVSVVRVQKFMLRHVSML